MVRCTPRRGARDHGSLRAAGAPTSLIAELIKYEGTACNPVDDKFLNYELREPVGVCVITSLLAAAGFTTKLFEVPPVKEPSLALSA